MKKLYKATLCFLMLGLVVGYNNCSKVNFSNTPTNNGTSSLGPTSVPPVGLVASIKDVPALVGWYIYTPNTSSANTTSNPPLANVQFNQTYGNCPALNTSDCATIPGNHGQLAEYCYEPSGANGMYFGNSSGQYSTLKNYILSHYSALTVDAALSEIFAPAYMQVSGNTCFEQGLFYYALSYLWIPTQQNVSDPNWDINFSVESVDDGLQIISNDGTIVGNDYLQQSASFSLNKGSDGGPHLSSGANTIVAIWVDDNKTGRNISGDEISYTTTGVNGTYTALAALPPNVLRGYVYIAASVNSATVVPISGATVSVVCSSFQGTSSATDSNGFFEISNIPDGTCTVSTTNGSTVTAGGTLTFNHQAATTAIQQFYQGL